jgi:arsenical pump membrane protein
VSAAVLGAIAIIALACAILSQRRRWLGWCSLAITLVVLQYSNPFQGTSRQYLWPIVSSILFLVVAVPLGALLDRAKFFASLSSLIPPRYALGLLWIIAALTTTVLNLDASIVLLTPLYYRFAKRTGINPLAMVSQPLILSLLASSALPVSNLTNLIFAGVRHVSAATFLLRLGPSSLAASAVGYVLWRLAFRGDILLYRAELEPEETRFVGSRRSIVVGSIAIGVLLIGFLFGDHVGIKPFEVVGVVDVGLVVYLRHFSWRWIPFAPTSTVSAVVVAALAFGEHLSLSLHPTGGVLSVIEWSLIATIGATLFNNIPAVASLLVVAHRAPNDVLWGILLGVNMGPSLLFVGTLASILWLTVVSKFSLKVSPGTFFKLGAKVSVPSFVVGLAVLVLVTRV